MEYFYSGLTNTFYPKSLEESYKNAGTFPEDVKLVKEHVFIEFTATRLGMRRVAGEDGMPTWEEIPPVVLTEDQIKSRARGLRDSFIAATDNMLVSDYTINDTGMSDTELLELKSVRLSFKKWPSLDGWPYLSLPDIPRWLLIEAVNNGYRVFNWPET